MKRWMFGILLLLCAACGAGDSDRIRTTVTLDVIGNGGGAAIPTDFGWSVQLDEAQVHLGPVQFFEGEPLIAKLLRELNPLNVVATAYAHPGHYVPGEALADVLDEVLIDLRSTTATKLEAGNGVTGHYGSAEVQLTPSSTLAGKTVRLRGRGTKAGREIVFTSELALDEPITGIAVNQEVANATADLRMTVDLQHWLRRIDFDALATNTTTVSFDAGTQGHNAILRGVRNTAAYQFTVR